MRYDRESQREWVEPPQNFLQRDSKYSHCSKNRVPFLLPGDSERGRGCEGCGGRDGERERAREGGGEGGRECVCVNVYIVCK